MYKDFHYYFREALDTIYRKHVQKKASRDQGQGREK